MMKNITVKNITPFTECFNCQPAFFQGLILGAIYIAFVIFIFAIFLRYLLKRAKKEDELIKGN